MELVWAQIGMLIPDFHIKSANRGLTCCAGNAAVDLESFAKHAGRTKIQTDDVMLLTRRNEGLEMILREELEELEKAKKKNKKR